MRACGALLLIEFQYEWLNEQGKLYHLMQDKEQFLDSIQVAEEVITAARQTDMTIIHSGLAFSADYRELGHAVSGLRSVIPKHQTFLANGKGSEFIAPFVPKATEIEVRGRAGSSAFAGSNLDSILRNNNITKLYLMGYALHVCVESTLRAAHDLGYETVVIEDATSAFTRAQKQYFLTETIHHFGESLCSNEFINLINEETKHE